jgi:hypothetical protein
MPQPRRLEWADMNTAKLLETVRASGIEVTVNGEFLSLKAANKPSPEVLETLREHKNDLLHLLRSETSGWSADDWRDYFEERSAISEFDHGLSRTDADKNAYDLCVQEWLRQYPISSTPGLCSHCLQSSGLLPSPTGESAQDLANTWLHKSCSETWHQSRRDEATVALQRLGIKL